jgi:hypothetical protein
MSWLSCKSDNGWKWFVYLFAAGAIFQIWPWITKFTKNIVFDAILYDSIAVIVWTGSLMYWSGNKFSLTQWLGSIIVLFGLALIQRG